MENKKKVYNVNSHSKKENKIVSWVKENQKPLVFGVVGLCIGILVMGILWPQSVAKLKNGEEVIVSLSNEKITADDLYTELKGAGGLNALISLIDTSILNDKYDLDEEAADYATKEADNYYQMYESYYGMTKEEFITSNGFADENDFLDYLKNQFLSQRYYDDYLASLVTETEIEDFYKDEVFGKRTVHIFSATDKENKLEKVRVALKKGTKVSKLEDKYEGVTYTKAEDVTFASEGYSNAFFKQVASLGKGEYSKVFEDEYYGNVVVYVSKVDDKAELKDVEDDIISVLSTRKDQADSTLYYKAYIELREAYKIKFHDKEMEKLYNDTMSNYTKTEETKNDNTEED